MKVSITLTKEEATQLYLLAKQTEVCDLATETEKKAYFKMTQKVIDSIRQARMA